MKPKPRGQASQLDLFQSHFDQLLNLDHRLCILTRKIDWQRFDVVFADCYSSEMGAPGKDKQITQVGVTDCFVDKSYRGHDYVGLAQVHTAGSSTRKLTRTQKKRRKRRCAAEPKIGHLKSDNRMGRCFLRGLMGDEINAVLAAAGANLQKLLRAITPARFCGCGAGS